MAAPVPVGSPEVGRHVPIPATSEEAQQAAASRAQTRLVRTIAGVTLVLAAVAVGLAMAAVAEERPDSAPANAGAAMPDVVALESSQGRIKGQPAAKSGSLDTQDKGIDLDRDAWELALQTAGQAPGAAPAELVASEDDHSQGASQPSERKYTEASAQQVRDRLAKLQVQLNKAMEEMNAKMLARKSAKEGETESAAAERQKQLEAWQAHPLHKQKRREAVEASERLQDVVARLQEKRDKRLASAREANAEPFEQSP